MGFSAGGEIVSIVVYSPGEADPRAADPLAGSTAALTSRS